MAPSKSSHKSRKPKDDDSAKDPPVAPVQEVKRRRFIPLDDLIKLDWDKFVEWTVSKPTLLKNKDRVHISDHDYEVTPLDPLPNEHATLELSTNDRFLIVPIKPLDGGSKQGHSLLVHEEGPFDKGRLFIIDAEPPDDNTPYQRLLIIGKESDEPAKQEPRIIGAVKAMLAVDDPPTAWTITHSIPSAQSTPASDCLIEQPPVASYDEDLLKRLDALNIVKECCDQASEDIITLQRTFDESLLKRLDALNIIKVRCDRASKNAAAVQRAFNELVGRRYGLKVIPIDVNRTRYDEGLGHLLDRESHYPFMDDEIITAVRRTGYTRNGEVVRKADVVVNRHTTQFVRLTSVAFNAVDTLQVEMSAPATHTLGEVMREAAIQIDALDALYEWIHIFATGSTVQIKDLARRLVQASLTRENPRAILKEANPQHLQMSSLTPSSCMLLTLNGEAKSLTKLRDILYIEAIGRINKSYYPRPEQGWIFKEIQGLQPFLPKGIDEARFIKESGEILHEILAQISFARDFKLPSAQPTST